MTPRYPLNLRKWSSAAFAKPKIRGLHTFQLHQKHEAASSTNATSGHNKFNVHCGSFAGAGDGAVEDGSMAAGGDELSIRHVLAELMVRPALYRVCPQHVVAAVIGTIVNEMVERVAPTFRQKQYSDVF